MAITVGEAIAAADALTPNGIDLRIKVRWLSELDGKIKADIIDAYEGSEAIAFEPYSPERLDAGLLVEEPDDGLYVHWLTAQVEHAMGEGTRYANAMQMYNAALEGFMGRYNRTHVYRRAPVRYFR